MENVHNIDAAKRTVVGVKAIAPYPATRMSYGRIYSAHPRLDTLSIVALHI